MSSISLVVIGLNDEDKLRFIYTSAYMNQIRGLFSELIYVDSRSKDNSIQFMNAIGFKSFKLSQDSVKSASAGRRVGALESQSDFVLFLDSDMQLDLDFELDELVGCVRASRNFIGAVGDVIDVYPDGGSRTRLRRAVNKSSAASFGGFVVFERKALIAIGNWNPSVPANEELELHSRIKSFDKDVMYTKLIKVNHYTVVTSPVNELLSVYLPLRKGRYGAYGFAIRGAHNAGVLIDLLKLAPEPIYFLLLLIGSLVSYTLDFKVVILVLLILYLYLVLQRRSLIYLSVIPGIAISLCFGLFKYKQKPVKYESC
jgi:glycosyltransferase involved in cell wall biosynthesis